MLVKEESPFLVENSMSKVKEEKSIMDSAETDITSRHVKFKGPGRKCTDGLINEKAKERNDSQVTLREISKLQIMKD